MNFGAANASAFIRSAGIGCVLKSPESLLLDPFCNSPILAHKLIAAFGL